MSRNQWLLQVWSMPLSPHQFIDTSPLDSLPLAQKITVYTYQFLGSLRWETLGTRLLLQNASTQSFWICLFACMFEGREITRRLSRVYTRKAPLISKCFSSTRKQKPGVFKYLRLEERFRNVPISVGGKRDPEILRTFACLFSTRRSLAGPLRDLNNGRFAA